VRAVGVPVGALDLRLPKWTFRTASSLNSALAELGMPTAFDERTADFAGMTSDEQLYISHVMQEAFIAVDEAGTAAATAVAIVDRPFLFVIHDLPTATPLFIGRITDPSA
jgi:serpin B